MSEKTIKQRHKKIRNELEKKRLDGLIVTGATNVTHITGFRGDDSWAIISKRDCYLVTDSRYTEQAQSECSGCKIVERRKTLAEATAKIIGKAKSIGAVGVEDGTSLAVFKALKKHLKVGIKQTKNIVESIRSGKGPGEIRAIRAAVKIASKALRKTLRYIKPGVSEYELAGVLDFQMRKLGGVNSFETIVAFGANASRPHHKPTCRKLKSIDTILIDFGAKKNGYCCDLTRCFVMGKASRLYARSYKAVQEAQQAAINTIRSGVEIARVDAAARAVLARHKLPVYGHGTGHGIGLEVHELPIVAKKRKGKLVAGMVITIEPGVYIPGKVGVRIEDDILVTESGYRNLSMGCRHQLLVASL